MKVSLWTYRVRSPGKKPEENGAAIAIRPRIRFASLAVATESKSSLRVNSGKVR